MRIHEGTTKNIYFVFSMTVKLRALLGCAKIPNGGFRYWIIAVLTDQDDYAKPKLLEVLQSYNSRKK